jgi:hypothetical protein
MIVSVTLRLILASAFVAVSIIAVVISMLVRAHDLMIIRAPLVRALLRADQRRGKAGHRESQGKQCRFPKMLAHVAVLIQG